MVNVSKGGWAHFNLTFWYGGGSHTLSSLITPLPKLFSTPFGCYATTPTRKQPAMRPPSLIVPEPQRPVVRLTQHVSSRWQTRWLQPNATRAQHSGCGGRVTNLPVFFPDCPDFFFMYGIKWTLKSGRRIVRKPYNLRNLLNIPRYNFM
jgi:hypothetical protein